jgi:xanthine dehydrogenase accessory factor
MMRSIHPNLLDQIRIGNRIVLTTVVQTSGSTPQKPGSRALFDEQGLLAGTIGGGVLEGEVQKIAESVLISGYSDYFYFNLDAEPDSDGAICGGEARVLVDADPSANLSALEAMEMSLAGRSGGFLLTTVSRKKDQGRIIRMYWIESSGQEDLPSGLDPAHRKLLKEQQKQALRSGFAEIDLEAVPGLDLKMAFLEHIPPRQRLVIVGGGHIGKALSHIGTLLEFEVSVLDDRPEYANRDHIPDADHLIAGKIGVTLKNLQAGPDTYIVIVSRGHRQDGEALQACIQSDAAYIGMIGSAKKVGRMKKLFLQEGWATPEQWARIHAPIGLPIGSKSVQEIAISIAAQLVEVRNKLKSRHGE